MLFYVKSFIKILRTKCPYIHFSEFSVIYLILYVEVPLYVGLYVRLFEKKDILFI